MASENILVGEVARALMGVTFPAGKVDIAEFTRSTHSNDELVHLLAQLPDREYASMAEIEEALAERSSQHDPSSEHLEKIQPMPPDQVEAVRKNQRSVESALDPEGLPQSENYGKRSGAGPCV